jgi:hypothetical protein
LRQLAGVDAVSKHHKPASDLLLPSLRYWLRYAVTTALERDPVDAAHDAGLLAMVLDRRATQVLVTSQADLMIEKAKKGMGGSPPICIHAIPNKKQGNC